MKNDIKQILIDLWHNGIKSVEGEYCVAQALKTDHIYQINYFLEKLLKASSMCRGALSHFTSEILALMVTKYHHTDVIIATPDQSLQSPFSLPENTPKIEEHHNK